MTNHQHRRHYGKTGTLTKGVFNVQEAVAVGIDQKELSQNYRRC